MFESLLMSAEAIEAMSKVRAECNRVMAMSLVHAQMTKTMRLEEFEQAQSTQILQVWQSEQNFPSPIFRVSSHLGSLINLCLHFVIFT